MGVKPRIAKRYRRVCALADHEWKRNDRFTFCGRCGLIQAEKAWPPEKGKKAERSGRELITDMPIGQTRAGCAHGQVWKAARRAGAWWCYWCELSFTNNRPPTQDHVLPVSFGGTRADGIIFACQQCNNARGNVPFDKYLEAVLAERANARALKRSYRRPTMRSLGSGGYVLTAMTRREWLEHQAEVAAR